MNNTFIKIPFKIILLFFTAVLIYSCSKNDDTIITPGVTSDTATNFKYPFTLNSNWFFKSTPSYRYNPDSLHSYLIRNHIDLDSAIESGYAIWKSDTIINGINARVLKGDHSSTAHAYSTTEYYAQTDTGLVNLGFIIDDGTSFGPFRPNPEVKIISSGRYFNSIQEVRMMAGSDFRPENSLGSSYLNCIKYPIVNNTEWFFRNTSAIQTQSKKYLNYEQITTLAGIYNCIKIQRKNYIGNPGILDTTFTGFDYFSKVGMVKRTTKNTIEFRNSSDVIIGYLEISNDIVLNIVNIVP